MQCDRLIASTARRIAYSGRSVTLSLKTDTGVDYTTGQNTSTISTIETLAIVGSFKTRDLIENVINADDTKLTLQCDDEIKEGDEVAIDSITYKIMYIKKLNVNGMTVKYTLGCRT